MTIKVDQTSQTISWFKDLLQKERLVFRPPFQRKPVWKDKQNAYLIDTALKSLPIPEVYIQKETDEEGRTQWAVIDGQQRLRALLGFTEGRVELNEEFTQGRDGQTWEDLTAEEKKKYWDYRVVVREISDSTDADLRDLFRRLNINTVRLNAQEIRNAKFQGDFIRTVTELADQPFWAEERIVSATEIRRMADIEFMAELLVGVMHGRQNKKQTLEAMFEKYEDGIPDRLKWLKRFEDARGLTELLVPKLKESRWRGKSDYYSLFLALDELGREGSLAKNSTEHARNVLRKFGEEVSHRLEKTGIGKTAKPSVMDYASAVEKAASDKDRRESRHRILISLLKAFFKAS